MIRKIAGRHYFDGGGSTTLTGPTSTGSGAAATVNNNGLIGGISNILGQNNQFQGQSAGINSGTNTAQLNNAYTGAQSGLTQQQQLAGEVAGGGQQGVNTQNALTGQLEGVINGTGPNAAQTALNQNTATNVANQAALMAGQRGANANPGLIARESAQQGAATQQAAVGQGATLQAQQQIAAQGQLANLASTQVGQQAGAVGGLNTAQQSEQSILQNANTANNNANVAQQSNINNVNAATAAGNQQQAGNMLSGLSNVASSAISGIGSLFARGGSVFPGPHKSHVANFLEAGGKIKAVEAMVSPGEVYLSPHDVERVIKEGANPLTIGTKIPGKPKVKGDSLKNDTVPATLEEGGCVVPRHIMNKKSREHAELFVRRAVHMHAPKGGKS